MAEKVGVPTGQISGAGRPVFKTPEGELVSEKSVTIPMGTKFINIPSIHDGVQYSEDEIIDMLKDNKIEATSVHDSMEEAIEAAKARSPKLLDRGGSMESQMDMFEMGGLKDEGGSVDPVSGNDVPNGSLKEEVRDDIDAKLSEGEFVLPADVVRYIGLENIMKMRDMAKEGLAKMEAMGQMGNSEEATMDDETDFDSDIDSFIEDLDKDDEVAEFQVGGLAGQPTTPEQQAGQIYSQMTGGQFLPPGVTAPTVGTELPTAPVITPGGEGAGGVPTYETKQYIGPNGEIRTFTFINGTAFPPIPEGFTLYDPAKIPETTTGVPTAKVSEGGGDEPTATTPSVDPIMGAARAISAINPSGSIGKAVDTYDSRMKKVMAGMAVSAVTGSLPGLAVGAYKAYTAGKELKDTVGPTIAQNNPTLAAVLEQTGAFTMSERDVGDSISNGVIAGMSPGLASAITASGGMIQTGPPVTDIDPKTGVSTTREASTSISGLTGSVEQAVRNTYGQSLATSNPQAYRDMVEEATFMDTTGRGVMGDRTITGFGTAPTAPTAPSARSASPAGMTDFDREVAEESRRLGLTTAPTTYSPRVSSPEALRGGYSSREIDQLASDLNVTREQAAAMLADKAQPARSSITEQALSAAKQSSRTVTKDSAIGSRSVAPGETVSFQSESGKTTNVTGKSYSDAYGNTRQGGFVDSNNDGVQQKDERSTVTSGSGSTVTSRDGTPVTSRSQAQVEAESGGPAGDGTYCCTKMVEHGLWSNKKELAKMHSWHMKQPQWWRDGYDVWGKLLANTLLKTKSKFWTSVMQECYEYHVHNKKLNFKSALGNGIMYSGVFVFGQIANLTGRHLHEV